MYLSGYVNSRCFASHDYDYPSHIDKMHLAHCFWNPGEQTAGVTQADNSSTPSETTSRSPTISKSEQLCFLS